MIADHVGRPRSGPRPAESLGGTMSGRCRISAACAALALLAGPAAALPPVAPPSGPVEAKAESAPAPVAAPRVQPPGPGRPAGVPPPAPARPGELPRDTTRDPLNRLLDPVQPAVVAAAGVATASYPYLPTIGLAGPSGGLPRSVWNNEFETFEHRRLIGFPEWYRF